MTFDQFAAQALQTAKEITNKPVTDKETQDVAFNIACAMMAEEIASRR